MEFTDRNHEAFERIENLLLRYPLAAVHDFNESRVGFDDSESNLPRLVLEDEEDSYKQLVFWGATPTKEGYVLMANCFTAGQEITEPSYLASDKEAVVEAINARTVDGFTILSDPWQQRNTAEMLIRSMSDETLFSEEDVEDLAEELYPNAMAIMESSIDYAQAGTNTYAVVITREYGVRVINRVNISDESAMSTTSNAYTGLSSADTDSLLQSLTEWLEANYHKLPQQP